MPSLKNAIHERFARLVAQGMGVTEAFGTIRPEAARPDVQGSLLKKRMDVKERISEIREIIDSQFALAVGEKRDILRRMALGEIPTKIIKKANGKIEAVFDRHLALVTDAKLAGEFAPEKMQIDTGPVLKLDFNIAGRNTSMTPALEAEWQRLNAPAPEPAEVIDIEPTEATDALDRYEEIRIDPKRYPQLDEVAEGKTFVDPAFEPIPTE